MNENLARPVTAGAVLAVALYVYAVSDVAFGTHESVRLDKLAYSSTDGFVAQHHGDLLPAGVTTLRLDPGAYHFRTTSDVRLRVGANGSVEVVSTNDTKGGPPDPPGAPHVFAGQAAQWAGHVVAFGGAGSGTTGPVPALTVIRD